MKNHGARLFCVVCHASEMLQVDVLETPRDNVMQYAVGDWVLLSLLPVASVYLKFWQEAWCMVHVMVHAACCMWRPARTLGGWPVSHALSLVSWISGCAMIGALSPGMPCSSTCTPSNHSSQKARTRRIRSDHPNHILHRYSHLVMLTQLLAHLVRWLFRTNICSKFRIPKTKSDALNQAYAMYVCVCALNYK